MITKSEKQYEVGDVVLIASLNETPNSFELARIIDRIDSEKYVVELDVKNPDISIEIQNSEILGEPFFSIPFVGIISLYKEWVILVFLALYTGKDVIMEWIK